MTPDQKLLYDIFEAHIAGFTTKYSHWYISITNDVSTLPAQHGVGQLNAPISRAGQKPEDAPIVARALISNLGCDGNVSINIQSAQFVYAYLKSATSHP